MKKNNMKGLFLLILLGLIWTTAASARGRQQRPDYPSPPQPPRRNENQVVAVIYEHANFQGRSQQLRVGRYNMNQIKLPNDSISSIKILAGYRVRLYEHVNFGGANHAWRNPDSKGWGNVKYVGDRWNDKASSLIVDRW